MSVAFPGECTFLWDSLEARSFYGNLVMHIACTLLLCNCKYSVLFEQVISR